MKIIRTEKPCSKCKVVKPINDFYARSDKKHLPASRCIECVKEDVKDYLSRTQDSKKIRDRIYHIANRDFRVSYAKSYNQTHKAERASYNKSRYNTDPQYKAQINLRNRVRFAVKRGVASKETQAIIGCTMDYFRAHIESLFKTNMNWGNYADWELDHIIPCSTFDLTQAEDIKKCFHYSNYQPLWKSDNRLKSRTIDKKEVHHR